MAIEHPDGKERWVVKIQRGEHSSLLFVGTLELAKEKARELNQQYQTDEYKIEPFKGWN